MGDSAPWHFWHRSTRIGRIAFSKNSACAVSGSLAGAVPTPTIPKAASAVARMRP